MSDIDYPSFLPSPLVSAYSVKEGDRLLKTEMDNGYSVFRKRFTTIPATFKTSFIMDENDVNFFQSWYASGLDYGLYWFNMDLAVGAGNAVTHECRFLDNPTYALKGNLWSIKVNIQAISMVVSTTDYDSVIIGVIETLGGLSDASIYFDKLDNAVNVQFPSSGYGPNA